jgi:hypothetical protein
MKEQPLSTVLESTRSKMYVVSIDVTNPANIAKPITKAPRPIRRTRQVSH